jgi:hypothetical protein
VPHNKQLQRTVIPKRWRGASASFHYALAPRSIRQHAAAELRRYTSVVLIASFLSACVSVADRQQHIVDACDIVEAGKWTLVEVAPLNREKLLALELGRDSVRKQLFEGKVKFREAWFEMGEDDLLVCAYRLSSNSCSEVGDYVSLKRRGSVWSANSPTHIKICDPLIR